jgi:hypothetical protein
VFSLKKRDPTVSGEKLERLVSEEVAYLLPRGEPRQADKTIISNMARHLVSSLSVDPTKLRKITFDMFALQWNKTLKQLLEHHRPAELTEQGAGCGMACVVQ